MKHGTQATSHFNQGETTQDDEDKDGQARVDNFDFVDELGSDKIAYGYQFVQQLYPSRSEHYVRENNRYYLNMKHLKGRLDIFWVLLNNQFTVHIFWNTIFLVNICKTTKHLELLNNTGSTIINKIEELPGIGTV